MWCLIITILMNEMLGEKVQITSEKNTITCQLYYNYSNNIHVAFHVEGNEIKEKTCLLKIVLLFKHITNPVSETHNIGI